MSGDATAGGIWYQARAIALVYVHILAQSRLDWFPPADDTPVSIAGETRGPGDDARIEFAQRFPTSEIQAKHGLSGGNELTDVVAKIREKYSDRGVMPVALVVNRDSSRAVHRDFASDLDQLRCDRTEEIGGECSRLLAEHVDNEQVLRQLRVVKADLDYPQDPERKRAMDLLATKVLKDPSRATEAWALLTDDAGQICAKKLRRTSKELVDLLNGANIEVRPPAADERLLGQIEYASRLLDREMPEAALAVLRELEIDMRSGICSTRVQYQTLRYKAVGFLALERPEEALLNAQLALELDPDGVEALCLVARAKLDLGEVDAARQYATSATTAHSDKPDSWAIRLQVASAEGSSLPDVPQGVRDSARFRLVASSVAVQTGDYDKAVELTASLLRDGERTHDLLFIRAIALTNLRADADPVKERERWLEVERLASEFMDLVGESALRVPQALILRSNARRQLGHAESAKEDVDHATRLRPDDLDSIRHAAQIAVGEGHPERALRLLRHPAVEEDSLLLAFRSNIEVSQGQKEEAEHDLDAALRRIADATEPDPARFSMATTALNLGDVTRAAEILNGLGSAAKASWRGGWFAGQLAFQAGDVEAGADQYRKAAAGAKEAGGEDAEAAPILWMELGQRLLKAGRAVESVSAFEQAPVESLPDEALSGYAYALMQAEEYSKAQGLVDKLSAKGELPLWALAIAVDIAVKKEDSTEAIDLLTRLVAKDGATPRARIALAQALLEAGRTDAASSQLDILLKTAGLTPLERARIGDLLRLVGRAADALPVVHLAFRQTPGDPQIHRLLAGIVFVSGLTIPPPTEVGPETYVRFTGPNGEKRENTVYAGPPYDQLLGDISVEDARSAGVVGLRVGQDLVLHAGEWNEQHWTVAEILPAAVHAAQDIIAHYEERFPGEPFFVAQVHVGTGEKPRDFAGLIASLSDRKEAVRRMLAAYQANALPLGFVARNVGASIADLMDGLSTDAAMPGPLFVNWSDAESQGKALEAARTAASIVLSRSGLKTASDLGLLEALAAQYSLIAPRSLAVEIQAEADEARKAVETGRSWAVAGGPVGLTMTDLPAGHATLIARHDELERQNAAVRGARIESRPLETIGPKGSQEDQLRDAIGSSSYDAAALSVHFDAPMFVDDLGLRRIEIAGCRPGSFSSIDLLDALAERSVINPETRNGHLLKLVLRRYAALVPSVDLLTMAIDREPTIGQPGVQTAMRLLGSPALTMQEATRIAVGVIRQLATRRVRIKTVEEVTKMALDSMGERWRTPLCANSLMSLAEKELLLLPHALEEVKRACAISQREWFNRTTQLPPS
jgi:tetratricopeptide (TPR) repeat protein